MHLYELTGYLNKYLEIEKFQDAALNGLQIEGEREITKAGFSVDFSLEAAQLAAENNCQILICHHGIYWPSIGPITANTKERIKIMLDAGLSLYASHLPLDVHPDVGNNARIAESLDAKIIAPFALYHGQKIGYVVELPDITTPEELTSQIDALLNAKSLLIKAITGKERVKIAGIISGAAARQIHDAADLGLDIFITGEPSHSEYNFVRENKTHMICAGHYASETPGIKSLEKHIKEMFNLETIFFDLPTGL